MAHSNETRIELLKNAKAEFMEKGYSKASLRSICSRSGVTTGALYFFFNDKAGLYRECIGEAVDSFYSILQTHFDHDNLILASLDFECDEEDHSEEEGHSELAQKLIHHIYKNYDEIILLLTKSQGSEYENFVDEMVEFIENHSLEATEIYSEKTGKKKKINKYMLHFMIHLLVTSFVHLVTREPSEEKALANIKKIFKMTLKSWTDTVLD